MSEETPSSLVTERCQSASSVHTAGDMEGWVLKGIRGLLLCLLWCSHPCGTAGWGAIRGMCRGARSNHCQECLCPQLSSCLILSEVGGSTKILLALQVIVPECHTGGRMVCAASILSYSCFYIFTGLVGCLSRSLTRAWPTQIAWAKLYLPK